MKLYGYLLAGALGYCVGAKSCMMRKCAVKSARKVRRMMNRKLGL